MIKDSIHDLCKWKKKHDKIIKKKHDGIVA